MHRSWVSRQLAVALVLGACAFLPAVAQNFDLGADFIIGFPQKGFADNVENRGYGGAGHFGYFLGDSPIMIGANLGFLNYGTERRFEPFSETIPDVTVEVRTTNNILLLHGFVRVQPQDGVLRPYFEGLFGFKYLFTRTAVIDDFTNEAIASSTNLDDLAGSWGLGTGVDIRIWEQQRRRRGSVKEVSMSFGAKYLWGSEADYLNQGAIRRDADGITYLVSRSRTDMFLPHLGVRLRF
jgi:hypothetical protein